MIGHLAESTLLLAIALAVAHLPRLAARTRHTVVFAALLKFALPSAAVPRLLDAAGIRLGTLPPSSIAIRVFGTVGPVSPSVRPSLWPQVAGALWLAVAAAVFIVIILRARRASAALLAGASAPSERERAALDRARQRAGLRREIELLRSPNALAPAAIGLLRPRIVLPLLDLGDGELEAILTHECAHVARHDNALALIDAAAGAALWFHPLVWMARRVLARAREEACDAVVVARGPGQVYLAALAKICRAAIAPRVAGISCVVSNTLRERMEAMLRLELRPALPHRLVVAFAAAVLVTATAGSGVLRAMPPQSEPPAEHSQSYELRMDVSRADGNCEFDVTVTDRASGTVVMHPRVNTPVGVPAEIRSDDGRFEVRVRGDKDGSATATLRVYDDARKLIASSQVNFDPDPKHFTGAKISLDLRDADLRDVFRTFAQLTKTTIDVDPDVKGIVTVSVHDVPWDEAFDNIVRDNDCQWQKDGNVIRVKRAGQP